MHLGKTYGNRTRFPILNSVWILSIFLYKRKNVALTKQTLNNLFGLNFVGLIVKLQFFFLKKDKHVIHTRQVLISFSSTEANYKRTYFLWPSDIRCCWHSVQVYLRSEDDNRDCHQRLSLGSQDADTLDWHCSQNTLTL